MYYVTSICIQFSYWQSYSMQIDYYRVLYDDHFFALVKAQLEEDHTVFSLSTRSQMIDDYFKSSSASMY
jgi:hypothetical protein